MDRDREVWSVYDGNAFREMRDLTLARLVESRGSRYVGHTGVGRGAQIRDRGRRNRKVDGDSAVLERGLGIVLQANAFG